MIQKITGEEIYLAPTSNSEKESVKKTLAKELINRKISSIQLSERTDASVTTDLFWKYDKYCSENGHKGCSVWGDWLHKYSEARKRDFRRVTMENKERSNLCEAVIQRKKFVVSFFNTIFPRKLKSSVCSLVLILQIHLLLFFVFPFIILKFYQ